MKFLGKIVVFVSFLLPVTASFDQLFARGCDVESCENRLHLTNVPVYECLRSCNESCAMVVIKSSQQGFASGCALKNRCKPASDTFREDCKKSVTFQDPRVLWKVGRCPEGTVEVKHMGGKSCYKTFKLDRNTNFAVAKQYCVDNKYKLIEISSNDEITRLAAAWQEGWNWFPLANQASVHTDPDYFFLADGTTPVKVDRRFWSGPREPYNPSQRCVYLGSGAKMNDVSCSRKNSWPVVCEITV